MASTVEELEAAITQAVSPGFRGRLLDRGQARSMIWRDGALPPDAPNFSPELSYDLLSYGYSLLNMGMRLREMDGNPNIYRAAFSRAATSISVEVYNGNPADQVGTFHLLFAAAAFHLGHYGAKAYSLLQDRIVGGNLTKPEKALSRIILRQLDQLEADIFEWKISEKGKDESIADDLENEIDKLSEEQGAIKAIDAETLASIELNAIDTAITDNYFSALSTFLMALERGQRQYVKDASAILQNNLSVCKDLNLISQWWVHRVTIHLLDDLWSSSFHEILPTGSPSEDAVDWPFLRQSFISLLYRRKRSEIDLWPSQIEGATRSINEDDDLVVSLPTSAGKTRIAELCILRCLASKKRVIFITPLRALSAQTEITLRRTFLPLGKVISTLYGSAGTSEYEQDAIRTSDIVVGTPEKLDFALRNDPTLLDDVGLVVLDEGHMIGLNEREIRYEVQIQRLLKRADAAQRRIVCLSAILPDNDQLEDFVCWLRKDKAGGPVQSDWRPTDLRFGEVVWNNGAAQLSFRIGDEQPFVKNFFVEKVPPKKGRKTPFPRNAQELTLATAWRLVDDGHTVLIYCPQRRSVEPLASLIVDLNGRGVLPSVLTVPMERLATAKALGQEWLGQDHPILQCLDLGVAIHHGSLPTAFRKEVEKLLREGFLKITVSSPTLAQGLNLAATVVIMHSLQGHSGRIEVAEFKNVIGRAGRAFIDVQGIVLHPMFDRHGQRRREWYGLIQDTDTRNMESGLFRLVVTLLLRLHKSLGQPPLEELVEFIVNTGGAYSFPEVKNENGDTRAEELLVWNTHIANLDTAILSLLGEQECSEEEIPNVLDEILESSLWQRRLGRWAENERPIFRQALIARATHIWRSSTDLQRKGYFLAGVGLETGKKLDAIAPLVNSLIVQANAEILAGLTENAIDTITAFAEEIFQISPFAPASLPGKWKEILKTWLSGKPMADAELGDPSDVLRFVEEALVYRLPWGMEAVRVRAGANQDIIFDNISITDLETGLAVPAVENGTLNGAAAILMQAGFNSRVAAIKAIEDGAGTFSTRTELSAWLSSETIVNLTASGDWPTPETASIWKSFIDDFKPPRSTIWQRTAVQLPAQWFDPLATPQSGTEVRVMNLQNGSTSIVDANGDSIGKLVQNIRILSNGLYFASVSTDPNILDITFLGAGMNPFENFNAV